MSVRSVPDAAHAATAPDGPAATMDAMATWEDGPEYAPAARPDAFVPPDAAPLAPHDPAPPAPDADAPAARPDFAPLPEGLVPLDRIAPPAPDRRDPTEAFDVVTMALTPTAPAPAWAPPTGPPLGAWGSAHSPQAARPPQQWAPQQPFQPPSAPPMSVPAPAPAWPPPHVNPSAFPPAQAPVWGPPPHPAGPAPLRPVTFGQMFEAATPALMITLFVGGIVTPLALPLFLVANVLAMRVRHRTARVRLAFRIGLAASVVAGSASAWFSQRSIDLFGLWDHVTGWAQLACWAVAAAALLVQGDALRRGEPPENLA